MRVFSVIVSVLFVVVLSAGNSLASEGGSPPNVICFYADVAYISKGPLQVGPEELKPALDKCTHLIYEPTQICEDFEIQSLRPDIDLDDGFGLFRKVTNLKQQFPKLKVLISLTGYENLDAQQRYIDVLHDESLQEKLVSSILDFIKKYNFDGINLGWNFPKKLDEIKYIENHTPATVNDTDPEKTRIGFGKLVQSIESRLKPENYLTTVMVIPLVDVSVYYDIPILSKAADLIIVESHDFPSPSSKFDHVDEAVPIYYSANKNDLSNIEKEVRYFLEKGADAHKLIITADSYGTWSLIKKSDLEDTPNLPQQTRGGPVFYFEVCSQIKDLHDPHRSEAFVEKVNFVLGNKYFKQSTNQEIVAPRVLKDEYAIWIAYEDVQSVAFKTTFAKRIGLGGMALNMLPFDDSHGVCSGVKYPLLQTIATSWK